MTQLELFLEKGGREKLTRYALMLTNDNKEEAEDLISTVLIAAVEKPPPIDKNYEGWIMSTLHRQFAYYCRGAVSRQTLEGDYSYWIGEASYQPDLEEEPEALMHQLTIQEILKHFPPMDRYILYSVCIKDCSLSQVREKVNRLYPRTFGTYLAFQLYVSRLRERVRLYLTALPFDDNTPARQKTGSKLPVKSQAA